MAQRGETTYNSEQIRRATLFGFISETILTPYISPASERLATLATIQIVNGSDRWATGVLITPEDRENLAAMHILQSVANCVAERRRLVTPDSRVQGTDSLYESAQKPLTDLDLDFGINFVGQIFADTFRACRSNDPAATSAAQIVQDIWRRRGMVNEEHFNTVELGLALMTQDANDETGALKSVIVGPGGEIIPGYSLPETPTTTFEFPFYAQYISDTHGAQPYLSAFLEDITEINNRLQRL